MAGDSDDPKLLVSEAALEPAKTTASEAGKPSVADEGAAWAEREDPSQGERKSGLGALHQFDVIIGHPLKVVPNPRAYPWSAVVLLKTTYKSGAKGHGTGWFFSKSRIATAAHNLRHPRHGRAETMEILAGWDGTDALETFSVAASHIAPGWQKPWPESNDWAIIGTDRPASHEVGWFRYRAYDNGYPDGQVINITGFPADVFGTDADLDAAGLRGTGFQYMDSGYLADHEPKLVTYTISTAAGMSGGPVFMTVGTKRFALAIHTQGRGDRNLGRRIDNGLLATLDSFWA